MGGDTSHFIFIVIRPFINPKNLNNVNNKKLFIYNTIEYFKLCTS
jgi:hypothetical protein